MAEGEFNLGDFINGTTLCRSFGNSDCGFFSFRNITMIDNKKKRLVNVAGNSFNLKLNYERYLEIESKLPKDALMCDKSIEFLGHINNIVDFVCKLSIIEKEFKFNSFLNYLNEDVFKIINRDSLNSIFCESNCSLFISVNDAGKVSYSLQFVELSFRMISFYNGSGEHFFIFDVLGDSKGKYIINGIDDLHIIKNYIIGKSKFYGMMKDYGYKTSDDSDNLNLLKIVKIVTMASSLN